MPDPVSILLSANDLAQATAMAEHTLAVFQKTRGYYRNTRNSHFVGKLGEMASARWFEEQGHTVERLYELEALETEADLLCERARIEVKTWSNHYWADWGRCVATGQVRSLLEKADFVVWTSVRASASRAMVLMHGWSPVEDVAAAPVRWTGPPRRQVENHQLEVDDLRPMSQFNTTPAAS